VGLECNEFKDSSLIYKNDSGIYCQPEELNTQAAMATTQPKIMELPVMTKLCKENDKLTEKENATGLEFGCSIECNALGPMYTMCIRCMGTLTHTRKRHDDWVEEVNHLGNEEQDLSKWLSTAECLST